MDLRARLARLGLVAEQPPAAERECVAAAPDEAPPARGEPLEALVAGHWVEMSGTRCLVVERTYAAHEEHGGLPLAAWLGVPSEAWSPLAAGAETQPLDPRRALFLDIETTGLGRGSGTYAFLVGVGSFRGDDFALRQYFMPDYDSEEALLDLLTAELEAHQGLVTFNGRGFDWPILVNRFVLGRRAVPNTDSPHLDLLHVARRLWRRRSPSCALGALEGAILGVQREGLDVPGYQIPQLYQDYVLWGETAPLAGVFYHNAMDILAMVALGARAGRVISPTEAGVCAGQGDTLRVAEGDYAALGALYERAHRPEQAIWAYQRAIEDNRDARATAAAWQSLSLLYKRLGRYEEAVAIWQARVTGPELYPHLELAKHLEHRQRDFAAAQGVVEEALARVQAREITISPWERRQTLTELEQRLARLQKRTQRTVSPPSTANGESKPS